MLEARKLLQPGSSKVFRTANENKHQADIEIPVSVNFDKVNNIISNNRKHGYKELYDDDISGLPSTSSSRKRSYEELFGDVSDFLDMDVPGVVIN